MKPLIGITSDVKKNFDHALNAAYLEAIDRFGGVPIIIPMQAEGAAARIADQIDGLVVTGGGDINPFLYGEEPIPELGLVSPGRDELESAIIKEMLKKNKPILGICRGLQILNVTLGGSLYQDIHKQIDRPLLQHVQNARRDHVSHYVFAEKGSLIEDIVGTDKFKVNSYHHQAVKEVADSLVVSGSASDDIVEVIESKEHAFVLGVQWHPEQLAKNDDKPSIKIFERFISTCKSS